jgi:hypothetical protein
MLKRINSKLKDIDAKLSNPLSIQEGYSLYDEEVSTKTINRHTKLYAENTNNNILMLLTMMGGLENLMRDLNKLQIKFYNNREVQMGLLKDRVEVLHLRRKLLSSLDTGVRLGLLCLNDKKMLKISKGYEIDATGISFPLIEQRKIVPVSVSISRDSNVRLGTLGNEVLNSKVQAIHTEGHNDTFSVHRSDNEDIFLSFVSTFSRMEIINEVDFFWIEKPGQTLSLTVKDCLTGKILYDKVLSESYLKLDYPVETNQIAVEIKANAIAINQLDIKELSLCQRKYKDTLKIETIPLPSFSNKYLTLENVKYKIDYHKEFLDTTVRIKDFKLNSLASEEQIAGPYKDPSFIIESKIRNKSNILNYLQRPEYKLVRSIPSENDYKVFLEFANAKEFSLTQEKQNSNSIYLSLPISSMESFIDVRVDGVSFIRRLSSEVLADNEYFIQYTGTGYLLTFNSLPWKSVVICKINSMSSYIDKDKVYFPHAGLGSAIKMSYAKDVKKKRVPILIADGNMLDLKEKNIQRVAFLDEEGLESTAYTEKRISETLEANNYAIDYKSGLLYLGSGISGSVIVTYLSTGTANGLVLYDSREIPCPSDIEIFEYSGPLSALDISSSQINNSHIFGYQKYNRILAKINLPLSVIQLPSFLSLHKGSISLKNNFIAKKEIEYIDGTTELFTKEIESNFYDYEKTEAGWHIYKFRNSALPVAYSKCNIIFESSILIERKYSTADLVNSGDYFLNTDDSLYSKGTILYVKNAGFPSIPAPSIKVKLEKDISDDVFSVDYSTNTMYTKNLQSFNGDIKFKYSTFTLSQFSLAKEVEKEEVAEGNVYYAYVNNIKTAEKLLAYFSPTFESISIGIIG